MLAVDFSRVFIGAMLMHWKKGGTRSTLKKENLRPEFWKYGAQKLEKKLFHRKSIYVVKKII